jgi:hypothetical protein
VTKPPPGQGGAERAGAANRVLYDARHYRLELRPDGRTLILVRTPHPFVSQEDVEAGCTPVQLLLDQIGRGRHKLLLDTRDAIANNDPVFESWFAAHRRRMVMGFRRTALVVKTAVGGLQNRRLVQHDGTPVAIFSSLDAAFGYLDDESIPPPAPGGTVRPSRPPPTGGTVRPSRPPPRGR